MKSIANKFLTICVENQGAELCSMKGADGFEYLWQADPAVWGRHAPVLFPVIGTLRDNRYELNGKTCELKSHGFARNMDFALIEQSETSLVYQLLPTTETRECYPFEFELTITYRLNKNRFEVGYEVQNNGTDVMPFSIGAHPGFALPGEIENCFLEFEKPETLTARLLESRGLLSEKTVPVLNDSNLLPLSKTLFDRNALIFMDAKSEKITLGAKNSPRRLTVEFPGFPQLGIWSRPGAPFVCIEPWHGHADPEQPYGDIMNKPGIKLLPAGGTFTCAHRIIAES